MNVTFTIQVNQLLLLTPYLLKVQYYLLIQNVSSDDHEIRTRDIVNSSVEKNGYFFASLSPQNNI